MKEFFRGFGEEVLEVLDFELDKFLDMHNRYAWQVRERFSNGFVKKGLEFCKFDSAQGRYGSVYAE